MLTIEYPDLPISRHRDVIMQAMHDHQVVVVVGETGSGKTTQLPKMAFELAGDTTLRVGCTQPRRIAAASVSRRVAEELKCELGGLVGYQVRFEEKAGEDTRIKFMTDGILLAEIQHDPDLRQYHTIVLDEAHERSLNIDFLLGYLRLLLERRRDLKLVISSATMDAGGFSEFFNNAPVIHVEGRTYPVDIHYMPSAYEDEDLPAHVARAVDWLSEYDRKGDVLVFLPGEREIRETAEKLEGKKLFHTDILPLFARLGLAEQQRIFHPSGQRRRIILATNVAETSLTIPGIIYVVDSGLARISRYSPARQVQRLQIEDISKASARQRAGRCGRVCEGVCIRLYDEESWEERSDFTDPEIRRSSLAGVLLRMKDLGLPELTDFPLPDPPSPKLITEGYRTLREIGAVDRQKNLTGIGRKLARLPIDPRLARMILEARHEQALPEVMVIASGLGLMDPKERPSDNAQKADQAHAHWRNEESDFMSMLAMWKEVSAFRDGKKWRKNQLRKWCGPRFLNMMRLIEWSNLHEDLSRLVRQVWQCKVPPLEHDESRQASFAMIHKSILAGAPLQFGFWNPEPREYKGAGGRAFGIFPGSGLFRRKKRLEWIMGVELVETTRLWMRRGAKLDPAWVEQVAPQLCESRYSHAKWDKGQGAVYAKERVVCGGLTIIDGRRVHFGRVHPEKAREIMIREGLMQDGFRDKPAFLKNLHRIHEEVELMEEKLRRPGQLWCEDGVFEFLDKVIPLDICTEKAFHKWRRSLKNEKEILNLKAEDCMYPIWEADMLPLLPDTLLHAGEEYSVYYRYAPGEEDDGVTIGIHIDQMDDMPLWLPGWGMPGNLAQRAEVLLRTLPKELTARLQPMGQRAATFAELYTGVEPDVPLQKALSDFVETETGSPCGPDLFDMERLPRELVTKLWVCDDDGNELAMGTDLEQLRKKLGRYGKERFARAAQNVWSETGMKSWDCETLPPQVDVGGRPGFPALVDEGTTAGVRIYDNERDAMVSHRAGVVRLLALKQHDLVKYLQKKIPFSVEGRMALSVLGASPADNLPDLLRLALEAAAGNPLPRSREEFAAVALKVRQTLVDQARPMAELWQAVVDAERAVRDFASARSGERYGDRITRDLERQMAWLLRPGFLWKTGVARLPDLRRFLKSIHERLERIGQQPLARELDRIEQFNETVSSWYEEWAVRRNSIAWDDFGYLVEEYRLSSFAPKLVIKGRVSAKKLQETRQKLAQ